MTGDPRPGDLILGSTASVGDRHPGGAHHRFVVLLYRLRTQAPPWPDVEIPDIPEVCAATDLGPIPRQMALNRSDQQDWITTTTRGRRYHGAGLLRQD